MHMQTYSEQMKHSVETDLDAIVYISKLVCELGEKIETMINFAIRPNTQEVHGQQFRGEVSVIPDYEKENEKLCIQIQLRRRGPGRHVDRYVYVRLCGAGRRLNHPRQWR